MDIQIATLCDFAADYNGKLVITGTFDTLAARAVPVVHPACALALRFCFTPEDAGRHKLSINIINEDGESLDPNNMPIEPEFEVQLPKNVPFLTRNIVMNLQGLRFAQAGIYSVDIGCDGEVLVRLPLRIVQVTQGANGGDIARRAAQHQLGIIAHSQNGFLAVLDLVGHHRRLVQHNAAPAHVDQRVGSAKVDGHVRRENSR
jgi:hypothetical protein